MVLSGLENPFLSKEESIGIMEGELGVGIPAQPFPRPLTLGLSLSFRTAIGKHALGR